MPQENKFAFLNARLAQMLEADPEGLASLSALEGRRLVLVNADLHFGLCLSVEAGQLLVRPMDAAPTTTTEPEAPRVIGGLSALGQFVRGRDLSPEALLNACEIEGDADQARQWFQVLVALRPDLARPFAGLLADEQWRRFTREAGNRLHDLFNG